LRLSAILAAVVILSVTYSSSFAQVFYQYPGAPAVERQHIVAGTYLSGGEDLVRLGGYGRVGFAEYWDFGFEGLVENEDGNWRAGAGGDLKYQLFPTNKAFPFDVSLDIGFGFTSGDNRKVLETPIGGIISSPLKTDDGQLITPYVGVYAVFLRTEIKRTGFPDITDNDLEALIRGGVSIQMTDALELFGTLQLGPADLLSLGLNIRL